MRTSRWWMLEWFCHKNQLEMSWIVVNVRVIAILDRQVLLVPRGLYVYEKTVLRARDMFGDRSCSKLLASLFYVGGSAFFTKLQISRVSAWGWRMRSISRDVLDLFEPWNRMRLMLMSVSDAGFLCCVHLWQPILVMCRGLIQGRLTSCETNCKIFHKRLRQVIVAWKMMKGYPILCNMQPGC